MLFGISPVVLLLVGVILILGMILSLVRPTKQVLLLRRRDRRGKILRVARETDLGLVCRKTQGVVNHYIKAGTSWMIRRGMRMVTTHFAMEGTAYTAIAKGSDSLRDVKDEDGNTTGQMIKVNVEKFLRHLWGDKFYDALPQEAKGPIEKDIVGITVEIAPIHEETWDLDTLSADDINDENDSHVLNKLAGGQKPNRMDTARTAMVWLVVGALAMYMLVTKGMI